MKKYFVLVIAIILAGGIFYTINVNNNLQQVLYENGELQREFQLDKNGLQTGLETQYYMNGKVRSTAEFKKGMQHGFTVIYYENGNAWRESFFINGVLQ